MVKSLQIWGWRGLWVSIAALALSPVTGVYAQANPFSAPTGALDTLSGIQAPSAGNAVQNAREIQQQSQMDNTINLGDLGGLGLGNLNAARPAPGQPGIAGGVAQTVVEVIRRPVKAVVGTRVFDAVTQELLDDARVTWLQESEKDRYFDDGTHGDLEKDDGVFALVDERRDVIGQSNQRLKEQLIQALVEADKLDPLEFYGYSLLTTERINHPPRKRIWKIIPDASGVGYRMAEEETATPLEVPKLQEKQREKDDKIAGQDGWAKTFLEEYRQQKGVMDSRFFPMYIPQPPTPPNIAPPSSAQWTPFPNPGGNPANQAAPAAAPAVEGMSIGGFGV